MDLPFSFEVRPSGAPSTLLACGSFERTLEEAQRVGIEQALRAFAELGKMGALSGSSISPAVSTIETAACDLSGRIVELRLAACRIDPLSLSMLANIFHWVHLEVAPLVAVTIEWEQAAAWPNTAVREFPGQWLQPSFAFAEGDLDGGGDVDVGIEFLETRDVDANRAFVENVLGTWLLATHRGAFADDVFSPAESAVYLGPDVMTIEPDRVVLHVEDVRCDEAAWSALVNLLEGIHHRGIPLRRVELGPLDSDEA